MGDFIEENIHHCGSRLPCGLCLITQAVCPFWDQPIVVTCSTATTTGYDPDEFFSAERSGK